MPTLTAATEATETLASIAEASETLVAMPETQSYSVYPGSSTFPSSTTHPGDVALALTAAVEA